MDLGHGRLDPALERAFAAVFDIEGRLFGLPVTWVYVFTVWAGLIVGAWFLAGRLSDAEGAQEQQEEIESGREEA